MMVAAKAGAVDAVCRALDGETVAGLVPDGSPARYLAALRPELPVTEPGAAVVVATSGSTGDPKGVVLSRDAIAASVAATHQRLGGPGLWVCPLPVEHVAGMMTIARGLLGGGGVRLVRGDLSDVPIPDVRAYLSVVPAQLHRALGDATLAASLARYAAVLVGGSAIPAGLLAGAREQGIHVVTTYGMSETCGGCVYDGTPLEGVRVDIESDGRVVLAGPMVFAGYRLDPGRTRAVLRDGAVCTQDRGRFEDGRLRLLGRFDDVVISGGVNVDLAAAQQVADAIWGVDEAERVVLFAVDDERWGARVVAVCGAAVSLDEVVARLRPHVEAAAIPRELRHLVHPTAALAGKIDRNALRAVWDDAAGTARRHSASDDPGVVWDGADETK